MQSYPLVPPRRKLMDAPAEHISEVSRSMWNRLEEEPAISRPHIPPKPKKSKAIVNHQARYKRLRRAKAK